MALNLNSRTSCSRIGSIMYAVQAIRQLSEAAGMEGGFRSKEMASCIPDFLILRPVLLAVENIPLDEIQVTYGETSSRIDYSDRFLSTEGDGGEVAKLFRTARRGGYPFQALNALTWEREHLKNSSLPFPVVKTEVERDRNPDALNQLMIWVRTQGRMLTPFTSIMEIPPGEKGYYLHMHLTRNALPEELAAFVIFMRQKKNHVIRGEIMDYFKKKIPLTFSSRRDEPLRVWKEEGNSSENLVASEEGSEYLELTNHFRLALGKIQGAILPFVGISASFTG